MCIDRNTLRDSGTSESDSTKTRKNRNNLGREFGAATMTHKTINVTLEVHKKLVKRAAEFQIKELKPISINETIKRLLNKDDTL